MFANELISSFGGCLLHYENLLQQPNPAKELEKMKATHTDNLKSALDLSEGQDFSAMSLKRYDLLLAIDRGEKIIKVTSPAAKYLIAKHGDIEAFLGVHPDGHLVFALPMTTYSLKQIEPLTKLYVSYFRYIGWLYLK